MTIQDKRIYYNLLKRVGNNGKYQRLTLSVLLIMTLLNYSSFLILPFLFYQQPYTCHGINSIACTQYVCTLPLSQRPQHLPPQTINSLATQNPNYQCQSISAITGIQEAMLLGGPLGVLMALFISDALGRRKTIISAMLLIISGIFIVALINNIIAISLGLMMWIAGADISLSTIASYLAEIGSQEQRPIYFTKLSIMSAVGASANAILFYFIKDWLIILWLYYFLLYLTIFVLFLLFVQSPPIQIISKSANPRQSYSAFLRIAEWNHVQDHGLTDQQIETIYIQYHQNQKNNNHTHHFTLFDICRYSSLRTNFVKTSIGFFLGTFMVYAPIYLLQKIIPNIFLSALANGLSRLATVPAMPYINRNARRKKALIIMNAFALLFMLLQYLVDPVGCLTCLSNLNSTLLLVFFFISRFFINMTTNFYFMVMTQTFPAQVRSICIFGMVGIGKMSILMVPFIPVLLKAVSIPYNIFFAGVEILLILDYFFLKETLHLPPPQLIQQLQKESHPQQFN